MFDLTASVWRTDWHRYDNFCDAALSQRFNGGAHGCSSGQSVIHENDNSVAQLGRGTSFAIDLFASFKFGRLPNRYSFNHLVCMWYRARDIFVQNAHTAGSYRAGSQFFKAGNTKFAHDKNIERRAKPLRDFERHRHTAPWQP